MTRLPGVKGTRRVTTVLTGAGLAAVLIQLVPVQRSNPPIAMEVPAPEPVRSILRRACYDCHSNETVWPWYARVAPVSWLVASDVREGRDAVNFSTWDRYGATEQTKKLRQVRKEVDEGEMPPGYYKTMHPEAHLSAEELATLYAWASGELLVSVARGPGPGASLENAETIYQQVRGLKDQIDVTRARGADTSAAGVPLEALDKDYRKARERLRQALRSDAFGAPAGEDRRALEIMRATLEKDLADDKDQDAGASALDLDCSYDAGALSRGPKGLDALTARVYACFGKAAEHLPFEGQVLDRLTVFSLLPLTADRQKRRRLFLAEEPVWAAVNGRNGPDSPYRILVRLSAAKMKEEGTSIEGKVKSLGADPALIEAWLVQVLEVWKASNPETMVEPWDFAFRNGAASRALSPGVSLQDLRALNDRYYRDLGADPVALGVRYDLLPRAGKDPVALTTFGIRPHPAGAIFSPGEPWVFAAYNVGGIDNLAELLHETGHAVHIAAIRGRPAFVDWPDSDTFTEAIADIAALEIDEPAWQRKYLGAEVPLAQALSAKYAGIVMDVAWSLFEIRMHRDPAADPNQVWTAITRDYLRIQPHPELSWWAVRGQLINAPGYMLNYAAGGILVADLRERARELHGPYSDGDPSWYAFMSERLYRHGLARTSRQVIEDFLGRPMAPGAILDDMRRAQPG